MYGYMYDVEPILWLKLLLIIAILLFLFITFSAVLRKCLKVERKLFFKDNYVNDKHKKIDWTITIAFIIVLFIGFINLVSSETMKSIWFLEPLFLTFLFAVVSETARAIMERKYASNKNDYIFTVTQLAFLSVVFLLIISTNFFGLGNW